MRVKKNLYCCIITKRVIKFKNVSKFFGPKDINKILNFMAKDKKNRSNNISLVLLKKIGSPIINKEYSKKKIVSFLKIFLRN